MNKSFLVTIFNLEIIHLSCMCEEFGRSGTFFSWDLSDKTNLDAFHILKYA